MHVLILYTDTFTAILQYKLLFHAFLLFSYTHYNTNFAMSGNKKVEYQNKWHLFISVTVTMLFLFQIMAPMVLIASNYSQVIKNSKCLVHCRDNSALKLPNIFIGPIHITEHDHIDQYFSILGNKAYIRYIISVVYQV